MSVALSPGVSGREDGFSLIELMIVVAIIGILAGLAIYTYGRVVGETDVESEVHSVFGEFEQRQEQYHVEHGRYLSTGSSESDRHPSAPAGPGDDLAPLRPLPDTWEDLRFSTRKSGLRCSYVAIAGDAGDSSNVGSIASGTFGYEPPARDWYYLLAECDTGLDESEVFLRASHRETTFENTLN